jgi:hypothetical protein
MVVHHVF